MVTIFEDRIKTLVVMSTYFLILFYDQTAKWLRVWPQIVSVKKDLHDKSKEFCCSSEN